MSRPRATPAPASETPIPAHPAPSARAVGAGARLWRGISSALSLRGGSRAAPGADAPARPLSPPAFAASHVLRVLKERRTSRELSPEPLAPQLVADLLWAVGGVNRPATGQRTAPTAHDGRYIRVYVFDASGVSLYDPDHQAVRPVLAEDLRPLTGTQALAATAPLTLLFVAAEDRLPPGLDADDRMLFEATAVGAMCQNAYLLCAEQGLAVGVRADIDRRALRDALGLGPGQRILVAQSVGRPLRPQCDRV